MHDLLLAFRALGSQRAFSLAAIMTLALGIGANSAIFSVIYAVLLQPLSFSNPQEIVAIHNTTEQPLDNRGVVKAADYIDFRQANQTMTDIAIVRYRENLSMTIGAEPEAIWGNSATPALFTLLGVKPLAGRVFTEDEGKSGKDTVVLIAEGLWKRRFGSDPNTLGRRIVINGIPREIVGILPAAFEMDRAADAWIPQIPSPSEIQRRFQHRYRMYGRLKPGVSVARAQQDFERMHNELREKYPRTSLGGIRVVSYAEDRVGAVRGSLTFLWLAAGLVLLIACANVANLLLARAASRQREVAIRAALGASRYRLIRQMLAESVTLALIGAIAGTAVAAAGLRLIVPLLPANLPGRSAIGIHVSTLLFTSGAALLTGILFGLSPALQAARTSATEALRQRSPAGASGGNRVRAVLVVFEIALSVMLLVGGGLLLRTLETILRNDSGLNPARVVTMVVGLPLSGRYKQPGAATAYFQRVTQRLALAPGVEAAAAINRLPLSGAIGTGPMSVEGSPTPSSKTPTVDWRSVTPDYFKTMGISLLFGRGISEHDQPATPQIVVIDDKLAATYWPKQDPIGKRVKLGDYDVEAQWMTIVGVVRNVRHDGLDVESIGQAYRPTPQFPIHGLNVNNMAIVVRVSGSASNSTDRLRREVLAVDPDQPPYDIRTMEAVLENSLAPRKFSATLVGFFAALALTLASIGVYGVVSYLVALRTNEIGIRMALGASPADVAKLIGSQTALLAATGIGIGIAGSLALAGFMKALLYGVSPFDPTSFGLAAGLVGLVAILATVQPARRAMSVDPVTALADR